MVGRWPRNGDRAVSFDIYEVRGIVERVLAQRDVLEACARRDLGTIITVLGTHGVTQGQISELTGIGQGRLSEWARHKRTPTASATFEAFWRPTWKNLVFTGPPGSGKSRTAVALGQAYRKLGVLSDGRVLQVASADLVGAGPEETGKLVGEAARPAKS
jgi:hypothetical protein